MKTRGLTLAALPLLLLAAQSVQAQTRTAGKTTAALDSGWTFRQVGKEEWRKARVPGSVHTDLLANGLFEDPFYRDNEPKIQWIGKTDWGWKQNLPAKLWDDYKKVFHGVLPGVVAEHDPSRPYWPSSPSSNLEEDSDSQRN